MAGNDSPQEGANRNDMTTSVVSQTVGRLRTVSVSAANRLLEYNPARGMWQATGTAIAHAPNLTDLASPITGGDNIIFDVHGHSAREAPADALKQEYVVAVQTQQRAVTTTTMASVNTKYDDQELEIIKSPDNTSSTERKGTSESADIDLSGYESTTNDGPEVPIPEKAPLLTIIRHGLVAFWKFFITPTGFLITLYGLNVVAWGAMLFFLELKAAPAMNHPDNGDADSSPRKIWLEIDSQILNALFCLTAWGLAPWRFRDLYWICQWRFGSGLRSKRAIAKLAERNQSWFRMRECDVMMDQGDDEDFVYFAHTQATFTGEVAPPTATWKLDFVVWMMVLNSLFQVGMATFMWHWDRITRPSYGTGLFIGLGCLVSLLSGAMCWWEGRKIKLIEGPKVKVGEDKV